MRVLVSSGFLAVLLVLQVGAQMFPGMGFMEGIMGNVQRMAAQTQAMGGAMYRDGMMRARATRRFGPGETRFQSGDGSGFVYNSPDGTSSSYSYSFGGPSHGFMYSSGPQGTYGREW